ncbi:MAG: MBOAT family protein [Flavobacterium sp.]|uniref:MBOAT family O-acyltransferase n=1 Tax=Flavobacterium sp. TaxID=239 RepID=UPI00120235A8|nr:MBOAT family O-acyltransferase [Flavobacterium sp.]RZJ65399.1 MAG: MBOAT family protein [Flavobacterium sp.]
MIFNSFDFLFFLPVVFALHWFVFGKSTKAQNVLLLVASYFFYACWDWRFLFLLVFSTGLDYFTGLKMFDAPTKTGKKFWFWLSIVINLGFLGVFKYYNFFAESFAEMLSEFGFTVHATTLDVILPVGISFYTFHGLSYVIDIYNDKIKPERNFIDYSVFVSFFPLLVAGPIERATHLLPQIQRKRDFKYSQAVDGLRQILWGLFMKTVVADNCAEVVNQVFNSQDTMNPTSLAIGAVFFAFQIYGDFSGYSNIALGTARLFGVELLRNFAYPYFSRDIAEFWRRWHISLSTWFRDYLYIPLGGSKGGLKMQVRNTFIIFLVSGFWHGANWTFIVWGALNALYIMPLVIFKLNRKNTNIVAENSIFPSVTEVFQMLITFAITVLAWIFFRADNVHDAVSYIGRLFEVTSYAKPEVSLKPFLFILILIVVEWMQRRKPHGLDIAHIRISWVRWCIYFFVFLLILFFAATSDSFIYFQF